MMDTLKNGSVPLRLDTGVASVHLRDIFFAGDLCLPLYPTLFDYGATPAGLSLVPSFQVRHSGIVGVKVILELREGESFEFQSAPTVRMIYGNPDQVTRSFLDSKTCILHIHLKSQLPLVVLQVHCKRAGEEPNHSEQIEGGLFLAIVNNAGKTVSPTPRQLKTSPAGAIQVTEVDEQGRLHYKIFQSMVYMEGSPIVSAGLEPEPAFRVRQAEGLDVKISLAPKTDLIFVPRAEHCLEVALDMVEPPDMRPDDLHVSFPQTADGGPVPEGCEIQWISSNDPLRRDYRVTSFSMNIHELTSEAKDFLKDQGWNEKFDGELLKLLEELIENMEFQKKLPVIGTADPTIIDTPRCILINHQDVCVEAN